MKPKLLSLLCLVACLQLTYAQNSIGVENDLKGVMSTRANAGGTVISSFSNTTVKGTRYLFESWTRGSVTALNDEVYSANYSFNFDKMAQDIYAQYSNNKVSVLLDKSKVKRFTIGSLTFTKLLAFKAASQDIFYQALAEDTAKVSLYKLTTTRFVKANPNDIMNVRTGNLTSEYVDDITYYVSIKKGELKKINMNENNIKKVLKEKADTVDAYFAMNTTRDIDESFLSDLIKYLNE